MASILDYIAMFQPSPKQVKDQLSQAIEGSWETSPSGLMPLRKNRLTGETQWIVPPALEALWGGVSAPQRALSGELPAYAEDANGRVTLNPQMVDDAAALAGVISLGGLRGGAPAKTLASRSANIYNPPVKSPRPFEADYPAGAEVNDAGRLLRDIDGQPLGARFIAGRSALGEPDVAIPGSALDEIAKATTSEGVRSVAPGSSDIGNDVGRAVFRRSGQPDHIAVSKALKPEVKDRVVAHEIGHVVDELAGQVSSQKLNEQLRSVYNDLNNPQDYGKPFGPEQNRYRKGDVPRELWAEAIRGYLTDPNSLKTVAPEVAARIRKVVNDNPKLNSVIQFNMGGTPVPALFGAMKGDDKAGYSTGGGF